MKLKNDISFPALYNYYLEGYEGKPFTGNLKDNYQMGMYGEGKEDKEKEESAKRQKKNSIGDLEDFKGEKNMMNLGLGVDEKEREIKHNDKLLLDKINKMEMNNKCEKYAKNINNENEINKEDSNIENKIHKLQSDIDTLKHLSLGDLEEEKVKNLVDLKDLDPEE